MTFAAGTPTASDPARPRAPMASLHRGPLAALLALVVACSACSSDDGCAPAAPLAVLAAMPSELLPLLDRATVDEVRVIGGRAFHVGALGGVPVVLAMTGIGLVNATDATAELLDAFAVRGVVFSGVAGSPHRIADVTVPLAWSLPPDGAPLPADPDWLALARAVAAADAAALERCTPVPPDAPDAELVCMPFAPAIVVGGRGESSDPYRGAPILCRPGGGDVFGCDPALPPAAAVAALGDEVTVDMETAASAREAAARGLRFVAFRAVSDGAADPLGLPGFPSQFFAYYRLAAENAAIATAAFLEALSTAEAADAPGCS
jgi:nucleoside phosphorylase